MSTKPRRAGQIEYLKEGFILHWNEQILTVEVIDYHATMLHLPWKDIQALAAIATGGPAPKPPRPTGKRSTPPEV